MKNTVIMIVNTIIGVIVLAILMTTGGRRERSMELNDNLSSVVEETVNMLLEDKQYNIKESNEFLADLVENLSIVLDSECDITVNVEKVDVETGILSVRIVEKYRHPNGNTGMVECTKTVILNKTVEAEQQLYTIRYYVGDEVYKTYHVAEGDVIPIPVTPTSESGSFFCWVDENNYMADFSGIVTQDLAYYALWD